MFHYYHYINRQKGSVLLMSLMLLIVVTLLTFSVTQTVLLQEKMTNNDRDAALTLQVAEAALLAGEARIKTLTLADFDTKFSIEGEGKNGTEKGFYEGMTCDGTMTKCYINALSAPYADSTWVNAITTKTVPCGNGESSCLLTGKYVIVRLGLMNVTNTGAANMHAITNQYQDQGAKAIVDTYKYKVIAMGIGNNPDNKRVLVSYYVQSKPQT